MTFVRNYAKGMLVCDFFVSVSVRFQFIYVFVMMEVGSRRLVHFNVTSHPTAAWTLQQFREAVDNGQDYRFLIHDRDSIYSEELDLAVRAMGVRILKTPFRSPQANSHCERLVGSLRRDCLDFLIPINERHLREILRDWKTHYCQGRPHASLGPGLPEPGKGLPVPLQKQRHQIPAGHRVRAQPILGGLHHEYRLLKIAA
jgi:putative transposase